MDEEKIIVRISGLLAMTEGAGATEAEALAAAEKARELIDRYQIDIRKVAEHSAAAGHRIGSDARVYRPALKRTRLHEVIRVFGALGDYCDVVIMVSTGGIHPDEITVVGEPIDCKMAYFMIANLRASLDRAYEKAIKNREIRKITSHRKSFMDGATNALSFRLNDMAVKRQAHHTSSGCDLVITKKNAARESCERLFPEAGTKEFKGPRGDLASLFGGLAGRSIPIQQGMESDAPRPALK